MNSGNEADAVVDNSDDLKSDKKTKYNESNKTNENGSANETKGEGKDMNGTHHLDEALAAIGGGTLID